MAMAIVFAAMFVIMVTCGIVAAVMGWEKF
jgi:hypothetical protein